MRRLVAVFASTAVALSGCGGGDDPVDFRTTPSGPVTVASADFIGYGRGELTKLGLTPTKPDSRRRPSSASATS
jgi:hypothetical protein